MEYAVAVVDHGIINVFHSKDRGKIEQIARKAKEENLPYAILIPCEFTTV